MKEAIKNIFWTILLIPFAFVLLCISWTMNVFAYSDYCASDFGTIVVNGTYTSIDGILWQNSYGVKLYNSEVVYSLLSDIYPQSGGTGIYYYSANTDFTSTWLYNINGALPFGTVISGACYTPTPTPTPVIAQSTKVVTNNYIFLIASMGIFLLQLVAILVIMYFFVLAIGWPTKSLFRNIKRIINRSGRI